MRRRDFLKSVAAVAANAAVSPLAPAWGAPASSKGSRDGPFGPFVRSAERRAQLIANWDAVTGLVNPPDYSAYYRDGDTRGFKALRALDYAFKKVMREVREAKVTSDSPAVWSIYNMGYIVKTRWSTYSIDLKHRLSGAFVPMLDFALVTHNHGDHFDRGYCNAMEKAGKPVVSSFIKNTAFADIKAKAAASGMPDAFKIRDVAIRTFRVDHARAKWGVNFTTAFEMRMGGFRMLHTGDCGVSNGKLSCAWGRPDLWMLFPMTTLHVGDAMRRINPQCCVFGHLWELGHSAHGGRAVTWHVNRALSMSAPFCKAATVALWGDRII